MITRPSIFFRLSTFVFSLCLIPACTTPPAPPSAAPPLSSAATKPSFGAATQMHANGVGERHPTEDIEIWNFHPVTGLPAAHDLFRSASPLRDMIKQAAVTPSILAPGSAAAVAFADERAKRLYDKGIRTIISFESPTSGEDKASWIKLEKTAAEKAGIKYVSCPMSNSGVNSFETLSPEASRAKLEAATQLILTSAKTGGVLYHCSAGHDRTGIVTAYMRMKFEGWTADQAIAEMRAYGHNWPKFSHNNGQSSWHEDLLRAIAPTLPKPVTTKP